LGVILMFAGKSPGGPWATYTKKKQPEGEIWGGRGKRRDSQRSDFQSKGNEHISWEMLKRSRGGIK